LKHLFKRGKKQTLVEMIGLDHGWCPVGLSVPGK